MTIEAVVEFTKSERDVLNLFQEHMAAEFGAKDVEASLATMIVNAYVLCPAAGTGGIGREQGVRRFYAKQFIPQVPEDMVVEPISNTVGQNRLVMESIARFTHSVQMDWLLPGIPPTGKRVEVPIVVIVGVEGDKVAFERIYWDQATVLKQIGLLKDNHLPVADVAVIHSLMETVQKYS